MQTVSVVDRIVLWVRQLVPIDDNTVNFWPTFLPNLVIIAK
jgi:hypothetical protein